MNIQTTLVLPFLTSLLFKMVEATIMCHTCRSDKKTDCEINPPPAQPCAESGSGVVKSCSTIRILKSNTGELHQFIRSCSSSEKNGCFDSVPGLKTCALVCYTDGCNSSRTINYLPWSWLLVVVAIATKVLSC